MDTIFAGQENIAVYADDIIVFGKTEAEHDAALNMLLETARKRKLFLSKDKIQFKLDKIKYLGFITSNRGIEANPDKIRAIKCYTTPNNREEVQRFLGMITFLGKFIPDISDKQISTTFV